MIIDRKIYLKEGKGGMTSVVLNVKLLALVRLTAFNSDTRDGNRLPFLELTRRNLREEERSE